MGFLTRLFACFAKPVVSGEATDDEDESSSLFFDLRILQIATNFFSDSNKLGHGGFGPVYRGLLPNGNEVAVKKLSLDSRQGVKEFINEVRLLLKIQHKNLVMLLGCCAEASEKMLVYEYLPHKSLNRFLFGDKTKVMHLDWQKRYRIIVGVARGLLYLHEEAPERILHRDIKAGNILLDEQLNPKISDFGLARLFPGDGTHMLTFKASGTHGYMAPEYAMRGLLSVKTDVFSFGVLVLEIVSGRKNYDGQLGMEKADLLSYGWSLFEEGKSLELVDSCLDKCNPDEAAMCVQLGLLCCQAKVSDRPDMSSVHLMLSSDSFSLPRPGKPGIQGRQGRWTTTSTSTNKNTTTTTGMGSNTNMYMNTDTDMDTNSRVPSMGGAPYDGYSRNSLSISSMCEGR